MAILHLTDGYQLANLSFLTVDGYELKLASFNYTNHYDLGTSTAVTTHLVVALTHKEKLTVDLLTLTIPTSTLLADKNTHISQMADIIPKESKLRENVDITVWSIPSEILRKIYPDCMVVQLFKRLPDRESSDIRLSDPAYGYIGEIRSNFVEIPSNSHVFESREKFTLLQMDYKMVTGRDLMDDFGVEIVIESYTES